MSSTKNNNNQDKKKINSLSSTNKKNSQSKNNKSNPQYIYCKKCGVILDNIENFHYIFNDGFIDLDICNKCFEKITNKQSNNLSPLLPNSSLPPQFDENDSNIPKIRVVLINPIDNFNTNINQNISTTPNNSLYKEIKKDKYNKKSKNDEKKCVQTSVNKLTRCNSSECNENENDSSLLFFQNILNKLHNIDEHNSNIDTEEEEEEKEYESESESLLEFEWLGNNIKTIDDLITLGKSYDSRKRKRYNLNLKQLNKLVAPLEELQALVGMADVKKIIFYQLIYYLQNLDDKNVDMLHTVIVGPPGVGKTQLTYIIAKIYNRLGFLKTDKVICAKRDDLIGEYIGQTAPKTRKVLERALGGVLLLDEIYSLAPTSDRDFAREAIDMINMYLSEHAHDLVCVVAGYKKPTYEKFFSQNEGLARRFTHHFEIKGYSHDELALIFKKYLECQKWSLGATLEEVGEIIKGHIEIFPNFGGDMATLFACCKKAHSRRLLSIPTEAELDATKKKIQKSDILEAVGIYKEIKEKHSSAGEEDKAKYMHMYV